MKIDVKGVIVANDDKPIYEWLGMEATCPRDVLTAIASAKKEPLDIYINSPGGEIGAGSEIYAALQEYQFGVKIHVVGYACSAASVIACAGKSDMVRTGLMMIHNVSAAMQGDHRSMQKNSDVLRTADRAVAAAYCAKTGLSETELLEKMGAETWMTAQDAVSCGLIDEIAEPKNLKLIAAFGNVLPQDAVDRIRETIRSPTGENIALQAARGKLKLLQLEEIK